MCTPEFIAALFTVTQMQRQPSCPPVGEQERCARTQWDTVGEQERCAHTQWDTVGEQARKMCTHAMGYCSAVRRRRYCRFFATWIDSEGIMLSGISHIEKDKCCMTSIKCSGCYTILVTLNTNKILSFNRMRRCSSRFCSFFSPTFHCLSPNNGLEIAIGYFQPFALLFQVQNQVLLKFCCNFYYIFIIVIDYHKYN